MDVKHWLGCVLAWMVKFVTSFMRYFASKMYMYPERKKKESMMGRCDFCGFVSRNNQTEIGYQPLDYQQSIYFTNSYRVMHSMKHNSNKRLNSVFLDWHQWCSDPIYGDVDCNIAGTSPRPFEENCTYVMELNWKNVKICEMIPKLDTQLRTLLERSYCKERNSVTWIPRYKFLLK